MLGGVADQNICTCHQSNLSEAEKSRFGASTYRLLVKQCVVCLCVCVCVCVCVCLCVCVCVCVFVCVCV